MSTATQTEELEAESTSTGVCGVCVVCAPLEEDIAPMIRTALHDAYEDGFANGQSELVHALRPTALDGLRLVLTDWDTEGLAADMRRDGFGDKTVGEYFDWLDSQGIAGRLIVT